MLEEGRREMAADIQFFPAFAAFESQLKDLCVKEFPCGLGAWREPDKQTFLPQKKFLPSISGRVQLTTAPVKQQTDPDPQKEPTDALQDYVKSNFSPWHLDYTWSNEAEELRAVAVKSPWLIDSQFVLHHFRTLKILDKGVTDVDEGLLKLRNLEELVLSANFIQTVNARHLPRSLKVLELCANKISDISMLCNHPPLLAHLGLGYNSVSFIGDYITGDIWPKLLSLDLSHNNLTDLLDLVRKLSTLPKLQNLVLQGNPFCLIPGYRGYIIDSLRRLSILDDIMISADEKHHFKGLARRKEYILDEAKVTLEVPHLKGLPMPEEIKDPSATPEFPVIERLYFVQFMYLADNSGQTSILRFVPDDVEVKTVSEYQEFALDMDVTDEMRSVNTAGSPTGLTNEEVRSEKTKDVEAGGLGIRLAQVNTYTKPWAEQIEMEWRTDLVRDDLTGLRDFFKQGLNLSVIQQVVLCFPLEAASVADVHKDKPEAAKKKKQKDISAMELRREPPQLTTLASFHIPLDSFLEGEFEVSSVLTKEMVCTDSTPSKLSGSDDSSKSRKSAKDRKKGLESAKGKGKGKDSRNDTKGKKKGDQQSNTGSDESQTPLILEVPVVVRLHHWTTATDSLKEEEKNKE